jgi:hypothetical protein
MLLLSNMVVRLLHSRISVVNKRLVLIFIVVYLT